MKTPARIALGFAIVVVGAGSNSCSDALTPTTDAVVTLSEAGTWPRALSVAEIATITASVANGAGSSVLGVDLDWSSSDSSVVTIAKVATTDGGAPISSPGLHAVVTTHAPGTATIFARLTRAGFAPAELSIPVVVEQRGWDTLMTVSRIDTARINLGSANGAILEGATVTWQSSDVSVLRVDKLTTDPFRAQFTPRSSGAVTITATVTGPAIGRSVLQLPVSVGLFQVTQDAAVPWDTLMTVSDTGTLTLRLADAAGLQAAGVPVQWRSTNQLAVSVVNGKATALREGGAEIIATVGNPAFETTELRGVITVRNMQVTEAANWPDTLSVTDTTNLTVVVKDAEGATRASMNVRWSSTNPLAFKVESTGIASARVVALSSGGGEIIAMVGEGDFQTSELRARVLVLPLGVDPNGIWPDTLTVTDTVALSVTVTDAGSDPRASKVRWSSTNTASFRVEAVGNSTARIIAFSQGGGEIVATVGEAPFQITERRKSVIVVPLEIVEGPIRWPDTLVVLDTVVVKAIVRDARKQTRDSVRVRWSSTNPGAFTVDSTGKVAAVSQGDGQIVAAVGAAPFQVTERRKTISIKPLGIDVFPGTWPETLTVMGSVGVFVTLPAGGAPGASTVRWSSTNPSAFTIASTSPTTARITALRQGAGEIVATIGVPPAQVSERRQVLTVMPLRLQERTLWPSSINLTNDAILRVKVIDARGNELTGPLVNWRSTNESVLSVLSAGRDSGQVTGEGRGGGEIIASVGGTVGGVDYQVTEFRASLTVLQKWRAIDAGWMHSCAIAIDGTGYCWGSNRFGELGTGGDPLSSATAPQRIASLLRFDEIEAGGDSLYVYDPIGTQRQPEAHTCGRAANSLLCWGSFTSGQIGDGSGPCFVPHPTDLDCTRPLPTALVHGGEIGGSTQSVRVHRVVAGGRESCAVLMIGASSSHVTCWGLQEPAFPPPPPPPVDFGTRPSISGWMNVDNLTEVGSAMIAGGAFACVAQNYGGRPFQCRGANDAGQLGDSVEVLGSVTIQRVRNASGNIVAFPLTANGASAGSRHACALTTSLLAHCWGLNTRGQLGLPTNDGSCDSACSRRAVSFALPEPMVAITAGTLHTCALAATGKAYCWGSNEFGQLGQGTVGGQASIGEVIGVPPLTALSAGGGHTCGLTVSGALYCWGRGSNGFGFPARVQEPQQ